MGVSRIFSRGEGLADFQKTFEKFVDLFFESTKLIFRALPKHKKVPVLPIISAPNFLFWPKFWKLARAPPSKLVYIGAKGAFRKFLGSVTKNGYFKIVQKGDSLGWQRVESLRKRASEFCTLQLIFPSAFCKKRRVKLTRSSVFAFLLGLFL